MNYINEQKMKSKGLIKLVYIKINESVNITDRVGQIGRNNVGSKMIIIKYNNTKDIDIYFPDTNYTVYNRAYKDFLRGQVSSLYDKTILGVGYFGVGKYKSNMNIINRRKGETTKAYRCWINMLHRCYDDKIHKKRPTYIGCTVCEEWHNFQVFAEWYEENFYQVDEEEMHLDKDILVKGDKIYSPDTCIFVPIRINSLFRTNTSSNLPQGVSAQLLKYRVECRDDNFNNIKLGIFKTIEEAFDIYKKYKESVFKIVADKYINKVPLKLYNAMYNYHVEIND